MQLHYYILHDCDLKSNGPAAFIRAMSTYALARDLERGVVAFPQDDPKALQAALATTANGGGADDRHLSVRLPQAARRPQDPADGTIDLDGFKKRVAKIVEKGVICQGCPACATAPTRFGCWGALSVPCDNATAAWLLQHWLQGVEKAGKSRLARWLPNIDESPAAQDMLMTQTEPGEREIAWTKGEESALLNIDRLVDALAQRQRLEFRELSELLADFGAVDWVQLKGLFRSLKDALHPKKGVVVQHPDPILGPIPFLHQPRRDDSPAVLEWKAFLFACYWALSSGREMHFAAVAG